MQQPPTGRSRSVAELPTRVRGDQRSNPGAKNDVAFADQCVKAKMPRHADQGCGLNGQNIVMRRRKAVQNAPPAARDQRTGECRRARCRTADPSASATPITEAQVSEISATRRGDRGQTVRLTITGHRPRSR